MENLNEIEEFSNIILDMVKVGNIEHVDAILTYCEKSNTEVESIIGLISEFLKSKIEEESIANRLIKTTTNRIKF